MKHFKLILLGSALAIPITLANPTSGSGAISPKPSKEDLAQSLEKHSEGSRRLAHEQDDLSADVQDLIDEQTHPQVIQLLREIEVVMADATDLLEQEKTGGPTIATETEVIEKIFEAAKKKKQQRKEEGG